MKQPKQHFTLTSLCVVLLATLSVVGGCSTESIDPGAGTDDGTPMPLTICATASSFDEALTVPADRLSFLRHPHPHARRATPPPSTPAMPSASSSSKTELS